jgi:DNA-binding SARP family transcriptional activator/DNA-binding CsgD family transcriptional regulator
MRLKLLGPLELVDDDGVSVVVSAPKRRAVLAVLALDVNRVVSLDRLVAAVWGQEPPPRVRTSLQVHVSALRRVLGSGFSLMTQSPGYSLLADADLIDCFEFGRLVERAGSADDETAVALLERALGLWRGRALAGVPESEVVEQVVAGLAESRLVALEALASRLLRLGRGGEVVAVIAEQASHWPPRESMVRLLMLGLYQSGQQHRALEVYDETRRRLAEELGVDPTASLREAFETILRGGPASTGPARVSAGHAVPAVRRSRQADDGPVLGAPGKGVGRTVLSPNHPVQVGSRPATRSPLSPVRLVGRESALALMDGLVADLANGRGGVVTFRGEPGIGKSVLLSYLVDHATDRGVRVCAGTAERLESALPFAAIGGCLEVSLSSPNTRLAEIARMLRGEAVDGARFSSRQDIDTAVTEALVAVVEDCCAVAPLVIVLDDLQWADPASVVVIHLLGRAVTQLPLLLVTGVREVRLREDVQELLRSLGARAESGVIDLAPLDGAAVIELAEDIVGASVSSALRDLVAGGAGNPLYVGELVRGLMQAGRVAVSDGIADATGDRADLSVVDSSMRSLTTAIDGRLRMLSKPTQDALSVAALLGARFTLLDLAVVLGQPVPTLLDAVREATDSGVLHENRDGTVGFRHDLIRQALTDQMPATVRMAMHHQAARALSRNGASPERVGAHIAASGVLDDWVRSWMAERAEKLLTRSPGLAVDLLSAIVRDLPAGDPRYERLQTVLCSALLWSERYAEATKAAGKALAASSDPRRAADLHSTLIRALYVHGDLLEAHRQVELALATPGLTTAEILRLRGHELGVLASLGTSSMTEMDAGGRSLLTAARDEGEPDAGLLALLGLGGNLIVQADFTEVIKLIDGAEDLMANRDLEASVAAGLVGEKAAALTGLDRIADATRHLNAHWSLTSRMAGGSWVWVHSIRSELAFRTANWDDALVEAGNVYGIEEYSDQAHWFGNDNRALVALIAVHRGDFDIARKHLDAATGPWAGGVRLFGYWPIWAQALLSEADGRPDEALTTLHTYWVNAPAVPLPRRALHFLCADILRLAADLGRGDLLAEVGVYLRDQAATTDAPSAAAAAALAAGIRDDAPDILAAAVEQYRGVGRPTQLAIANERHALALARAGRRAEAAVALDNALRIYQAVRASWDITRVTAELSAHGVRGTAVVLPPSTGWAALSDTERTIATQLERRSNTDIAATLHLTRRAVQFHIDRILDKLGCTTRAEIVTHAVQHLPAKGDPPSSAPAPAEAMAYTQW